MIVASLPSLSLLLTACEAVSVSGIILFYSYLLLLLNTVTTKLFSLFPVGHNPKNLQFANKAVMLVICVKSLFIVRVFTKIEHLFLDDNYSLIYRSSLLSYYNFRIEVY